MTLSVPVPADTEPTSLDELIADARRVPVPRPRVVDLTAQPCAPHIVIVPDAGLSLVEGYAEYGSC